MPIPTDERQEDTLNPGQQDYDRRFNDIAQAEERGTFNDTSNTPQSATGADGEDAAIQKLQNSEASSAPYSGWNNGVSGSSGSKKNATFKNFTKKKGPMAAILGILGIGGFGFTMLFSPAMLLVNMKETLSDRFNDQLAVLDIRSNRVLAKKIGKEVTTGVCSPVTIRCKYTTMSKRQLAKLEKAGIRALDDKGEPLTKRGKAATLEIDGKQYNAQQLQSELRKNSALRSAFNRAYNPKVAAFTDSIIKKTNTRLKISKKNAFDDVQTKEDLTKKLRSTVTGESFDLKASGLEVKTVDGKEVYTDPETGKTLTDAEIAEREKAFASVDAETKARADLTKTGGKITKSTIKGALTVTALGLGAVDSVCTGYLVIRTVSFAAKYIGMLQLVRYAHTFMNTADAIKAGVATPEQVEYLGTILTSTNSEGKSASDSAGYKYAAYGDSAMPTREPVDPEEARVADETYRYVNGQLVPNGVFSSIMNSISGGGKSTSAADETCKFAKSGWGQGILFGTAAIGAIVALGSGGISLGWGTGAQVAASVAVGVAIGILTPKLVDMASGTLVSGDENGNEAGNAIVSGMGAYNAQSSQTRGLAALSKEDALAYKNTSNETLALYNEVERNEANPLDATNRHSFVGSIASQLMPYVVKNNSVSLTRSVFGSFSAAASVINKSLTSKAASAEEFNQCNDPEYEELGLAADPFCNIKYGLSNEALAVDPDEVLDYMIDNSHIDPNTGSAASEVFKKYIKGCTERTTSIGGWTEEDDSNDFGKGEACIQGKGGNDETRNTMFRLYLIDKSIVDEMDGEETPSDEAAPDQNLATSPDDVKPYNLGWTLKDNTDYSAVPCAAGTRDDNTYRHPKANFTFRKCLIGSIPVNSLVSERVTLMLEAAKKDGVILTIGNSFRSYESQQQVYQNNCGSGTCNPPTATPGNSQHERGLAIDFSSCSASSACFKWLSEHAKNYGYYNLPSESWHWSASGW